MIKLLLKLAIAALIANAAVRIGSAYLVHMQFRDSVRQEIGRAEDEQDLQQRVLDVAQSYDVPQAAEALSVERDARQVHVSGEYVKPIMAAPGFTVPWTFSWEIDAYLGAAEPAR